MAKKLFSYVSTSGQDRATWEAVCPVGEFRVLPPSRLPPILASGLAAKTDSVLVVASGNPGGTALWMVNVHRVDGRAGAIDQEPLGIVFHGPSPALSGCLLHHGTWSGRTVAPPPEFWSALTASGIGNCYPFSELPSKPAGPISDLNVPSQHGAFGALADRLKDCLVSGR
jgi:hypothetical protein